MAKRHGPRPQKKFKTATEAAEKLSILAAEVRAHADFLDTLAQAVRDMDAAGMVLMTGNVHFGLEKIRGFCRTQVIQKLIGSGYGNPKLEAKVLGKLMLALGELGPDSEHEEQ